LAARDREYFLEIDRGWSLSEKLSSKRIAFSWPNPSYLANLKTFKGIYHFHSYMFLDHSNVSLAIFLVTNKALQLKH
jgi:hypothetical protein